jgi:DNA-directed RNA polymerase specialized sigma24 family protein
MDRDEELAKLIQEQREDDTYSQAPERVGRSRRVLSLDAFDGVDYDGERNEPEDLDNAHPIWEGETLTAAQFETQLRVEVVLDSLPTADRALLERRMLEGLTLEQMAREDGTTYQAIQQRLDTATRRFKRVWHELKERA